LLETILLSKKVAVIHCREHQRELWWHRGNNWANQNVKRVALQTLDALRASIWAFFPPQEPIYPKYTTDKEKEPAQREGHKEGDWWCVDAKLVLP
jgi:hypothetical protein